MRYSPRYSVEDQTQEDAPVAGDPIKLTDTTGQSREKSDDYSPFGTGSGQ